MINKNDNDNLKNICKELNIPWTNDTRDIKNMIKNKYKEAEYNDQLKKDL